MAGEYKTTISGLDEMMEDVFYVEVTGIKQDKKNFGVDKRAIAKDIRKSIDDYKKEVLHQ